MVITGKSGATKEVDSEGQSPLPHSWPLLLIFKSQFYPNLHNPTSTPRLAYPPASLLMVPPYIKELSTVE